MNADDRDFDDSVDLDAYLGRVGYDGPREPTPGVLRALVERHMAAIPFEAIDVLLGRGVDLTPAAVDRKLIDGRRGGYCFEHASLMRRVLRAIGFPVSQYLARVRVRDSPGSPSPPATHAALKVQAGGRPWLVDVGFGGFMPNEPLAWEPGAAQETKFGAYRLVETPDGLLLQSLHQEAWAPLYDILDFRWRGIDFKVANHYTATYPDSHFRHGLMAARTESWGRTTLAGNLFRRVALDGAREERSLDAEGLAEALASAFGLPVADDWRPMLARVAEDRGG
ncbi:arylamine N-acetyltransferase [Paludisphaera sp.]|uniref:arylamine N-acetyltransferase family protein n=1 Tax=Paludisphaera sp. TaxID=2017432 RepID=UPI00301D5F09